jgi:hypothetical protein
MPAHPLIAAFYKSDIWRSFREMIILTRGTRCEHCGMLISEASNITLHHKEPLTPDNVHDATISLNPDNVLVVHGHPCHDEIEQRFGHEGQHKVFLVYGAPLSGKTTYVLKYKGRNDLVVDINNIFRSITHSEYKPQCLLTNAIAIQNTLIDNISTRNGKWQNAFIVGGYPDRYKRDLIKQQTGALPVLIDTPRDVCIARIEQTGRNKAEYTRYIEDWFERYVS